MFDKVDSDRASRRFRAKVSTNSCDKEIGETIISTIELLDLVGIVSQQIKQREENIREYCTQTNWARPTFP